MSPMNDHQAKIAKVVEINLRNENIGQNNLWLLAGRHIWFEHWHQMVWHQIVSVSDSAECAEKLEMRFISASDVRSRVMWRMVWILFLWINKHNCCFHQLFLYFYNRQISENFVNWSDLKKKVCKKRWKVCVLWCCVVYYLPCCIQQPLMFQKYLHKCVHVFVSVQSSQPPSNTSWWEETSSDRWLLTRWIK